MSDIFISKAHSTATQANAVAEALRALGYGVWLDDELPAHRNYTDVIDEQLRRAKAVLVIWSAAATQSEWVRSEANRGREARKLIQMSIDNSALPMPFDQIQCVDMTGWSGDTNAPGWRKILDSVTDLLRPAALARHAGSLAAMPNVIDRLLAVLAFDNLSGDVDMQYFSDGVSEEIQQTVARAADLKVIGRNSSFQLRGANKATANVAAELKATHILDGSVRRSGTKVRIAAQLIECATQTTMWSDRFDRELADIFAVQDEIASAVAAALKVAFAPQVHAAPIDPAVYDLFLRAHELLSDEVSVRYEECAVMLERAVALAPTFARAWAALARARVGHIRFGECTEPYAVMRAGVIAAAETALRLDPHQGSAYVALCDLKPFGAYREREALLERAVSVAPNDAQSLVSMFWFNATVGRYQVALAQAKRAYQLDPLYPRTANWYANLSWFVGDHAEAERLFEIFCARWPDKVVFTFNPARFAVYRGDEARFDALLTIARAAGFLDDPEIRRLFRYLTALRNGDLAYRAAYPQLIKDELMKMGWVQLHHLTSRFGFLDERFAAIEQASYAHMFEENGPPPAGDHYPGVIFDDTENLDMIRDIRFISLCAKLGLCDYWVSTDRWPDCAEAVAPYYDFKAEARRLATTSPDKSAEVLAAPAAAPPPR